MICINYDINKSLPNKFLTSFLLIVSSVVGTIKFLHYLRFKTGLVTKANKRLSNVFLTSEGLIKVLEDREDIDLEKFYLSAKNNLSYFRTVYTELERNGFFGNSQTKELCDRILQNLYKLEAEARVTYFSNTSSFPGDKELVEMASRFSLSSARQ